MGRKSRVQKSQGDQGSKRRPSGGSNFLQSCCWPGCQVLRLLGICWRSHPAEWGKKGAPEIIISHQGNQIWAVPQIPGKNEGQNRMPIAPPCMRRDSLARQVHTWADHCQPAQKLEAAPMRVSQGQQLGLKSISTDEER